MVILLAGVVRGQELGPGMAPPAAAPSTSAPPESLPPPNSAPGMPGPAELPPPMFAPSSPASFTDAPPENVAPAPQKMDPLAGGLEGLGMDGRGMGGMGMGGMGGAGRGGLGYTVTWYPTRAVSNSAVGEDLGLVRQNLSETVPVWRNGGDVLMLTAGVRNTLFFTDAVLPDSGRPFPDELWSVHLGTNYLHKFDNGWSGMLGVNFGSASDKPFNSIHEMDVGFMSFLQVPVFNNRDAWRFSLMYSPVGNLDFPIPGVAYLWNPLPSLHVSVGIPFSVVWRPLEDLTFNVSYMPLTTVTAKASYRVVGKVFVYGGFESAQEAYLLAGREDLSDRFMGYEKRLLGGVRWDAWEHATFDVSAGYAFDCYYGIGHNEVNNLQDQVDIAPGGFLSTSLRVRF